MSTKDKAQKEISKLENAPPEFVESLAETAHRTLTNWLEANGAPEEAIELLRDLESLRYYAENYSRFAGSYSFSNYGIGETIIGAANRIAALGGVFHGPETNSNPRPPLKWSKAGKC